MPSWASAGHAFLIGRMAMKRCDLRIRKPALPQRRHLLASVSSSANSCLEVLADAVAADSGPMSPWTQPGLLVEARGLSPAGNVGPWVGNRSQRLAHCGPSDVSGAGLPESPRCNCASVERAPCRLKFLEWTQLRHGNLEVCNRPHSE